MVFIFGPKSAVQFGLLVRSLMCEQRGPTIFVSVTYSWDAKNGCSSRVGVLNIEAVTISL